MSEHLSAAKVSELIPDGESGLAALYERLLLLAQENIALKAQLARRERKAQEEADLKFDLLSLARAGTREELALAVLKAAVRRSGASRSAMRFLDGGEEIAYTLSAARADPAQPQYLYARNLKYQGRALALVELAFDRPQPFEPSWANLKALAFLARFSAKFLAQLKRYHEAVYLAAYDGLTGLGNRRVFDETLLREYERALRHQLPLALLVIDLDHFKLINDGFGHQTGDLCLKVAARVIKGSIRLTDCAARIGGEEFAVILPDTTIGQAQVVARRIRAALKAALVHSAAGEAIPLTASLGLADNRFPGARSAENLLHWADQAMYLAKEQGRDQIRLALELPPTDEEKTKHVFQ